MAQLSRDEQNTTCQQCRRRLATMKVTLKSGGRKVPYYVCDSCAESIKAEIRDEFEIRDKVGSA
jgi:protein-arginine kinase activator protein McsA